MSIAFGDKRNLTSAGVNHGLSRNLNRVRRRLRHISTVAYMPGFKSKSGLSKVIRTVSVRVV